jgi:hypothetical protein
MRILQGEEFKDLNLGDHLTRKYAISNFGRLCSYKHTLKDGKIIYGSDIKGYTIFRYKGMKDGKPYNAQKLLHVWVAEQFVPKQNEDQIYVLHKDYNRSNNHYSNLVWATQNELAVHTSSSAKFRKALTKLAEFNRKRDGMKLTSSQVLRLKKILQNPDKKMTFKKLAAQFNISVMQLHRIRNGVNWSHIQV